MKIPRPVLPREHGGWALFITPVLATGIALREFTWPAALLTAATLAAYLAYDPLSSMLRGLHEDRMNPETTSRLRIWTSIYLAISVMIFIYLLVMGYRYLLAFGAVGAGVFVLSIYRTLKTPTSVWRDLTAVIGISLTSPGLYYVLRGEVDRTGFIVWLLIVLFLAGNIFYVHMKIETLRMKSDDLSFAERMHCGRWVLPVYGLPLILIPIFSSKSYVHGAGIMAFLPMTIHVIGGIARLNSRVNFRRLGFLLLAQSLLFGVLLGYLL